jgi:hypothetical protein
MKRAEQFFIGFFLSQNDHSNFLFSTNVKFWCNQIGPFDLLSIKRRSWFLFWDEAVLSKTVLSNFRPKKSNEWIEDHTVSLFWLFIAFLTWPNLTCFSRPLSLFFYHLWGSQQIFEKTVFERTTYPAYFNKAPPPPPPPHPPTRHLACLCIKARANNVYTYTDSIFIV